MLVEVFDAAGTLIGVRQAAGLLDEAGNQPAVGGRCSPTSRRSCRLAPRHLDHHSYVESASGVQAGGAPGSPPSSSRSSSCWRSSSRRWPASVPAFATAPALLFVACLMTRELADVDWDDVTE